MSGDNLHGKQSMTFYSDCMTESKRILIRQMTYQTATVNDSELTDAEWVEMIALKAAIQESPSSVHPTKMEKFTELLIRSDKIYRKPWRNGSPLSE